MRLIKDGPDIPVRLVQAHEDGHVVFFCGAGISYPAGLPGFDGLVKQIYDKLGETIQDTEQAAINSHRFDAAIDLLERRIRKRDLVRGKIANILTPADFTSPATTDTHAALLTLGRTRSGSLRLVTTNFDRIFCHVAPSAPLFVAPLLPIPKKTRWDGLVYLHGLLPAVTDTAALENLIVSSGDFGRAYLTERWASRFVTDLFRGYSVCFVGYSIDDPVLRYMMDAMSADRIAGEQAPEAFAFASYKDGQELVAKREWDAKGVTPILYNDQNHHDYLHQTLRTWANIYRDGLTGKRAIIARQAVAPPSRVEGDGQIEQVLWAITDPSGVPAKAFAKMEPVPDIAWLEVFTEKRFTSSDLRRFGITPKREDDKSPDFSLLDRPTPYQNSASMALVGWSNTKRGAATLDNTMMHLAEWLVRHLDKPEVLRWTLDTSGSLHPYFRDEIARRLVKNDIPKPLATIWRLICSGRARLGRGFNFLEWVGTLKKFGWSANARAELRSLLTPGVRFSKPIDWSVLEQSEATDASDHREPRLKDYADWEIQLAVDDYLGHLLQHAEQLPLWPDALADSLSDLTLLLRDVCDLMAELGKGSDRHDDSYVYHPSITKHFQNRHYHRWTILIDMCRDAWSVVADRDPDLAKLELNRWKHIPYPLFRRLALFGATNQKVMSPGEALSLLLDNDRWWLWSVETQRETMRLLVHLAPVLNDGEREQLYEAILAGPPRAMYRADLDDSEWFGILDREIWHRLEKLRSAGAMLSNVAESQRAKVLEGHPQWQLGLNEQDEFPFWMGSGEAGSARPRTNLPTRPRDLANALKARPSGDFWYEDNWRDVCQSKSPLAMAALMQLAMENTWTPDVWREALWGFPDEKIASHVLRRLGPCLERIPDDAIEPLLHGLASIIYASAKAIPASALPVWLRLVNKVLDKVPAENASDGDEAVSDALNHPVGKLAEALIRWWFATEPKADAGISGPLRELLMRLTDRSNAVYRHGRVFLARYLPSFYLVDRKWAVEHLLPLFKWENGIAEAKAMWKGYLWSPRIFPSLLEEFKPLLLATAAHYNDLGKHAGMHPVSQTPCLGG